LTTFLSPGFVSGGFLDDVFGQNLRNKNEFPIDSVPITKESTKKFESKEQAHHHWMTEALRAGLAGVGITSPNPSVGCVLAIETTPNSWIELARGCTEAYGGRHGERVAFDFATSKGVFQKYDPSKITAFVTLEPCSHTGKQPPCVDLILSNGIGKVVIAAGDPHALVNGQGIQKLKENGVHVEIGLLKNESLAFNLPFFTQAKRANSADPTDPKKLFWAGKWAQTLDGHLADDKGGWQWITGPESRRYAHWLRQKYDAIVVGAGTVLNDFPSLNVRDVPYAGQSEPTKIIFDPKGRILNCTSEQQQKLKKTTLAGTQPKVIYCNARVLKSASNQWRNELQNDHSIHFISDEIDTDPVQNFKLNVEKFDFMPLRNKPVQSVFVEGGPRLLSGLLETNGFDILHIFIAPTFLGGSKNRIGQTQDLTTSTSLGFPRNLKDAQRYVSLATASLGTDVLWELVPQKLAELIFSQSV
jgi:diaminohydroxyphosphoribosylaminopyrimidine deaminase / 5-amino-6-(5-phosphoribosylamino)uracil reductase